MKRNVVLILALLLTSSSHALPAKSKSTYKAFGPVESDKSVMLKSGSKQYKYFELDKSGAMNFEVTGPTRVKIRIRALLPETVSSGQYDVAVWEGAKIRAGRKVETLSSKITLENVKDRVGVARDVIFKVPKGKHSYKVIIQSDTINKFLLRFHQEKKPAKDAAYETIFPYEYARKERLKSGKSEASYYFVDEKGGARLRVIGPTKIKVYCRANFDPTLKEKSKFTLGVFEKDKTIRKFSSIANKSPKSVYPAVPDLIPSTLHSFTLDIPAGEHIYEFKKLNSSPPSLGVKFAILKSSLGSKK